MNHETAGPPRHDAAYKLMFTYPRMVEHLLRAIFRNLADELDLATLTRMSSDVVAEDLRQRVADRLWQADFSDRKTPPLLILLEFQSTPDPRMSLRILEYRRLLLEEAVNRKAAGSAGGRPLFIAIVIYNGTERWRDRALLEGPVPEDLLDYECSHAYRLVDVHAADPPDWPPESLFSVLVGIERARGGEQLMPWLRRLRGLVDRHGHRLAGSAMRTWLEKVVVPRHGPGLPLAELMESELDDEEVESMLAERIQGWWQEAHEEGLEQGLERGLEQGLERGREQGLEQGLERGLERGRKEMLVQQAAMKFGPDAAGELSHLLRGVSGPARLAGVARALIECAGGAEFLVRAREAVGPSG